MKRVLNLFIILTLSLTLASCGDDNQGASTVTYVTAEVDEAQNSTDLEDQVQEDEAVIEEVIDDTVSILAQYKDQASLRCSSNGDRMDAHYSVQNTSGFDYYISGDFNQISSPLSGDAYEHYLGLSSNKDLLVVTKLVGSSSINISISVCPYSGYTDESTSTGSFSFLSDTLGIELSIPNNGVGTLITEFATLEMNNFGGQSTYSLAVDFYKVNFAGK